MSFCEDLEIINSSIMLLESLINNFDVRKVAQQVDHTVYINLFQMAVRCLSDHAMQSVLALSLISRLTTITPQIMDQQTYLLTQINTKWDYLHFPRYRKLICLLTCQLVEYCTKDMLIAIVPNWSNFLLELDEKDGYESTYATTIPCALQGLAVLDSLHEKKMKEIDVEIMSVNTRKIMQTTIGKYTFEHSELWESVIKELDATLVQEFQRALLL